jgi:DNA-binding GntR family transcriptional regulator
MKQMLITQPPQNSHRTKEEYVYDTLRTAITRCELAPGQKLVIDSLSEELGVSPIPIRSALQRLQVEGLVHITPHTGAQVSEISPDTVNEIFMLLESLEIVAFNAAITKITGQDISQLQQLVDEMAEALQAGNPNHWYDLNNQFHLTVAQITQMKMLFRFTARTLDSRDRLRYFYSEPFTSSRMSVAHAEHCQMVKLLEKRDTDGLATLAAQHNRAAKAAYQKLIESQTK